MCFSFVSFFLLYKIYEVAAGRSCRTAVVLLKSSKLNKCILIMINKNSVPHVILSIILYLDESVGERCERARKKYY